MIPNTESANVCHLYCQRHKGRIREYLIKLVALNVSRSYELYNLSTSEPTVCKDVIEVYPLITGIHFRVFLLFETMCN